MPSWRESNIPPAGSSEPAGRKLMLVKRNPIRRFGPRDPCKCEREANMMGRDQNDVDTCAECPYQPKGA